MKRDKTWWANLTREERSHLVWLERNSNETKRSPFLPEDCSECQGCGTPIAGSGLCDACYQAWKSYIDKATGGRK